MPETPKPPSAPTDADVAVYIAEAAAELQNLARDRPGLRTLRYLLDMARMEAERAGKPARRPAEGMRGLGEG